MSIIGWIVIGLLAGWVASMVMNRRHGLVINLVIGLFGALIGGWIAKQFGFFAAGWISSFVVALGGAVILLFLLGLVSRPKA